MLAHSGRLFAHGCVTAEVAVLKAAVVFYVDDNLGERRKSSQSTSAFMDARMVKSRAIERRSLRKLAKRSGVLWVGSPEGALFGPLNLLRALGHAKSQKPLLQ